MLRVRELTPDEIEEFLRGQRIARLGCQASGEVYVVPIIYAYGDGAVVTVTQKGRKVAMLRENLLLKALQAPKYVVDRHGGIFCISWQD